MHAWETNAENFSYITEVTRGSGMMMTPRETKRNAHDSTTDQTDVPVLQGRAVDPDRKTSYSRTPETQLRVEPMPVHR